VISSVHTIRLTGMYTSDKILLSCDKDINFDSSVRRKYAYTLGTQHRRLRRMDIQVDSVVEVTISAPVCSDVVELEES
jgi:hypothetical protein